MIDADDLTGILITMTVMLVPISAIVGGYWQKIVVRTQQHREEMARIQSTHQTTLDPNSRSELTALRQELAALRDTTTQYDLSVERNMHEMMHRLQSLESRTATASSSRPGQPAAPSTSAEPSPQARPADYGAPASAPSQAQPEGEPQRIQLGG